MFIKQHKKTALIAGERQWSYNELIEKVEQYASLLTINMGDRMVIFSENRVEWIYAFYASWKCGAITVPVDFLSSVEDLSYILTDCQPSTIFCSASRQQVLNEALQVCGIEPRIFVFEDLPENFNLQKTIPEPAYNKDAVAVIIYTSGTTGSPKGVMLTFDNLMANIEGVTKDVKIYSSSDRVMVLLPLHHIFPLLGSMIIPLFAGGTVALSPSLNPEDIINTLNNNKITLVIGVPRFYSIIRKGIKDKIKKSKIASLLFYIASGIHSMALSKFLFASVQKKFGGQIRYLICGGAALDSETAKDLTTLGFEILEGYGMTEAAPMITFTRPGNYVPGSGGYVLPATKVEIRDGEIVASGRNIMKGYYNRPDETAEILKDGWLYTGDLGKIDEKGFVFVTGRTKEIIVLSNGKNINPENIEKKIKDKTNYVVEVGVFSEHDTLQAIIIPDLHKMKYDGITNYEDYFKWNIIDDLNKNTSPYKRIMKFFLTTEELPKTRLGKIQRFKLPEIASKFSRTKKLGVDEPDFKEYIAIRDYLESETENKVFPDDHLEMDIALDSLGKVTLLVFIENTFGISIPENEFMNYHTVIKLSEFVRDRKTRSTSLELVNWAAILKEKVHINLPKTQFTLNIFNTISKVLVNILFRMRGIGKSNIPEGPCIIAPNHQSYFDGFFVASFLKARTMKKTFIYAKENHWRARWMQFMARHNNVILMDINKDLKLSLQKMAAVLNKGKNIIIFPEGTRSNDGKLGRYKKTFAILSRELNVPIVPVVIKGSHKVLPAGSWLPRLFRKVSVTFLQPVYPANHSYDSLNDLIQNKVSKELTNTRNKY
jgi:long-chain acyl-CoA synthetase